MEAALYVCALKSASDFQNYISKIVHIFSINGITSRWSNLNCIWKQIYKLIYQTLYFLLKTDLRSNNIPKLGIMPVWECFSLTTSALFYGSNDIQTKRLNLTKIYAQIMPHRQMIEWIKRSIYLFDCVTKSRSHTKFS